MSYTLIISGDKPHEPGEQYGDLNLDAQSRQQSDHRDTELDEVRQAINALGAALPGHTIREVILDGERLK